MRGIFACSDCAQDCPSARHEFDGAAVNAVGQVVSCVIWRSPGVPSVT